LFTGVVINSKSLLLQFFVIFLGVNLTFFPQHFLGLAGIPRRYSDFADSMLFWNVVSSLGAYISFFSAIYIMYIIWSSLVSKSVVYIRIVGY